MVELKREKFQREFRITENPVLNKHCLSRLNLFFVSYVVIALARPGLKRIVKLLRKLSEMDSFVYNHVPSRSKGYISPQREERKDVNFFPSEDGNESYNLIGSYRGPDFPISNHSHSNACVSVFP